MKRHIRYTFNERGESVLLGPVSNPWPPPWRVKPGRLVVASNGRRVPGRWVRKVNGGYMWQYDPTAHKAQIV